MQIVVLAADMDLAEAVLGDAGGLQQHFVEGQIVAARQSLDGVLTDHIGRSAGLGLDLVACLIETLGRDGNVLDVAAATRRRRRIVGASRARRQSQDQETARRSARQAPGRSETTHENTPITET